MNNITKIVVLTCLSLVPRATLKSACWSSEKIKEEQDYQSDLEKARQLAKQTYQQRGDHGPLLALLKYKKSIKKMELDKDDQSLLVTSCYQNQLSTIRFLLSAKADVDARSKFLGDTALMCAAEERSCEAVQLLLAAQANPNLKNKYAEETALMCAAYNHACIPIYRKLLAAGANPFLKNKYGETALSIAKKYGNGQEASNAEVTHLVHSAIFPAQNTDIATIIASYVTTLELAHQVRIALDLNQNDDLDDNDLSKTIASYGGLEE